MTQRARKAGAQVVIGFFVFMLAMIAAAAVTACGGAPGVVAIPTPEKLRTDLHMGYYWGCAALMLEQQDHADTWWAVGVCNAPGIANNESIAWHLRVAAELQQARGAGMKHIVLMLPTTDIEWLRFEFARLSEGGYFTGWESFTLYPVDEPGSAQGGRRSDAEVTELIVRLRQLAFDTPGLLGVKMGVFYGCDDPKPGIRSYDRVGCFRYGGNGCARLEGDYAALRSQLAPGARLWMIPGGADIGNEGRQEPACWGSYAHRNADVWGVIGFLWQSVEGGEPRLKGIRDNGLRKLYCEMGRTILHPTEEPRCATSA